MRVEYVAFDGKKFESSDECRDYEDKIMTKAICDGGRFFDEDKVEFNKDTLNGERIWYAFFKDEEAINLFNKWCDSYSYGVPGIKKYDGGQPLNFKWIEDGRREDYYQYCQLIKEMEDQLEALKLEPKTFLF